ncbi:MAG TPA: hypothetical protein PKH02_03060 [Bacteroidales bacterium]|nr:hypothetical protein [Bacteroidales bacterium]
MSEKFKDKYRIDSLRASWHDYNADCLYFVTINTARRECYFGEIIKNKVALSSTGHIVNECWREISNKFRFVDLGPYVIMPNHVHGIIKINRDHFVETRFIASHDDNKGISADDFLNFDYHPGGFSGCLNPMINNGLSKVMRWCKGKVTFEIRKIEFGFAWQPGYYERIIRNREEYLRFVKYIKENPSNWIAAP